MLNLRLFPFACVFLVNVLISNSLCAQRESVKGENIMEALQTIQEFKSSVLLVRMRGYQKQFEILAVQGNKEKEQLLKLKIEEQLTKVKEGMEQYTFTNYYFYFDYDQDRIDAGDASALFIPFSDEKIDTFPRNHYILNPYEIKFEHYGTTIEGIQLLDKDNIGLKSPFPYYQKSMTLSRISPYVVMVSRMNANLHAFYLLATHAEGGKLDVVVKKAKKRPFRMSWKLKRMTRRMVFMKKGGQNL